MAIVRRSAKEIYAKGSAFSAEELARLLSITDDEISEAAASDPDAPLLSPDQLDRMVFERAMRTRIRKIGTR